MSRLTKRMILEMIREANCIHTPTLDLYFKSVWIGEELRQQIELSRRKLKLQ